MQTLVIALGGNALIGPGETGTIEEQYKHLRITTTYLARLVQKGYTLVVSHGNGPQVGNLLIQQEAGSSQVPPMPMDVCVAATQGQIGFMMELTLQNALKQNGIDRNTACIVTNTLVDPEDPAFLNPTKPIGPFYPKEKISIFEEKGFAYVEDSSRGYRRVVASPKPIGILQLSTIQQLIHSGVLVIAGGGGGIPTYNDGDMLIGVEAVIDKDLSTACLANGINADTFIILTGVEHVYVDFNKPTQKALDTVSIEEALEYLAAGQFGKGSMAPKIQAAIAFLQGGGKEVIITHPYKMLEALEGTTGTRVVR